MLASLLPGLRDLRVPLTVGYLWLLTLWFWCYGAIPTTRAEATGVVLEAIVLSDLLGPVAGVAAVSFAAYLIGSLVQLPDNVLERVWWVDTPDSRGTRIEYEEYLKEIGHQIETRSTGLHYMQYSTVSRDFDRALHATLDTLRPRLLVANQQLFGEYDRLAAEGDFRVNVCPPLLALGATAAASLALWWAPLTVVIITALFWQGLRRRAQAVSVIQRAVLTETITHPAQTVLDRFG